MNLENLDLNKLSDKKKQQLEKLVESWDAHVIEKADIGELYYNIGCRFNLNPRSYSIHCFDDALSEVYNHFTDENLAKQVSAYLKTNFLFIRKAIEFAQGYAFKEGRDNYFVYFSFELAEFTKTVNCISKHPSDVYMNETQAKLFAKWCNEHKKELGYA